MTWIEDKFPASTLMMHSYGGAAAFDSKVGSQLQITPLDLERPCPRPCYLAAGTKDQLFRSSEP